MSIRFSDLQVILPRSTQTNQVQPNSSEAAAVQQQAARTVNSQSERRQKTVNAGSSIDRDLKISEKRRRRRGSGNQANGNKAKTSGKKIGNGQSKAASGSNVLGENVDIKV